MRKEIIYVFALASLLLFIAGCINGQKAKLDIGWSDSPINSGNSKQMTVQAINTGQETIQELKVTFTPDVPDQVKIYDESQETNVVTLGTSITPNIAETQKKIITFVGFSDRDLSRFKIVIDLVNEKGKVLDRSVKYLVVNK